MQALEGWGTFSSIIIENPVSVATLVSIALKDQVPKDKVNPTPERRMSNSVTCREATVGNFLELHA